jgi:sugar transferase (PEP-CTERM system associated)
MFGPTLRTTILVVIETVLILAAVGAAASFRFGDWAWQILVVDQELWKGVLVAGVIQACLYFADLYDLRVVNDPRELLTRIAQALAAASLVLAALYFVFPSLVLGRFLFLIAAGLAIILGIGWRFAFAWLSGRIGPSERFLLVGTSPSAVALATELYERRHELGVEIVGFVDPDPAKLGMTMINCGVIGTVSDIPAIVESRRVDRVVVSLADARGKLPMDRLLEMKLNGVTFDHLPSVYEEYTGKIAVENLRPSWLIFSEGFRKTPLLSLLKRALDVAMALAGLAIGSPLFLLVALAVRLTSHGPVLYHQRRVGLHGHVLMIHKFRSMRQDAEDQSGPVWASKDGDSRVTAIGQWMRRARLDEMPQLVNVLRGEMSFVGPRPERPEFVADLTRQIPYYGQRHIVRPGITGWAQVRYTYGASTEDALQKLQYDLYYIKNVSVALDLYIAFETVKTVLLRRGA